MINAEVDPKALHFRQDTFATTINLSKSYLVEESFDDLERIEEMFPPNIPVYNPAEESWLQQPTNQPKLSFYWNHNSLNSWMMHQEMTL